MKSSIRQFIMKKINGIDKERFSKHLDAIQKESGKSRIYIFISIVKNFITRGIGYTDYFRGNYIDLTREEKNTFVTTTSFFKLLSYLNDKAYEVLVDDKIVFNTLFKDYIKRDFISLKTCTFEEFDRFLSKHKVVFGKQPMNFGGKGIEKIVVSDYPDHKALFEQLKTKRMYLVEEEIIQSKEVNEINPNVVNSFRVVTLYKDGKVHLLNNAFRINQDATEVVGSTNDLYFRMNEDGTIDSNVIDDYGNIYEQHPLTGKKFKEVKIPGVKESFEMCKKAAMQVPEVRYIGWDVAFTDDGPLLVEGNSYPAFGIIQHFKLDNSRTGHLKEVADALGDEMSKVGISYWKK